MRRFLTPLLVLGCLAGLTFACFGRALARGEQFAYRDAAHFYYPLYERVQKEWKAGRWPLWEPEENGGMPLMGNPTAAVLYPGKLVFALVPYPLGARLYVVGHALLAFGAMVALLRSWKTSLAGSALGGMAYAFGGPILFQYCNVIFLVGAAWLPLGVHAADQWVRLRRRWAILELAVVLAMQTLGGDPESAYLLGVCAGGYAAGLAWVGHRNRNRASGAVPGARERRWVWGAPAALVVVVVVVAVWVGAMFAAGSRSRDLRGWSPGKVPSPPLPSTAWIGPTVVAAWGVAGLAVLARWRRLRNGAGPRPVLVPLLAGLAASAALATALAAAQLLPVLEFTGQSGRAAGEGAHDIYPFSLSPLRLVEFLWPNVFGTPYHGNRLWLTALPPADPNVKIWVPTLYLGGLTVVLVLGSLRVRGAPPWRVWLTIIAVVSAVGSLGECGGPIWLGRQIPAIAATIGPRDPRDVTSTRADGYLRDGDGSFYALLAAALPGFTQFRYPSKLLTFTVLALTALAGQGCDALADADPRVRRRCAAWSSALLGVTLVALAAVIVGRGPFVAWLKDRGVATAFGPFDALGAASETRAALVHAALVYAAALALAKQAARRPGRASAVVAAAALIVMAADLAVANSRCVSTLPQRLFDVAPEVVSVIARAERAEPAEGPFRVHRTPVWNPNAWHETASADRVRDFVVWERATIQPKYGIGWNVQYTKTLGVAELYDHAWFFSGFYRTASAAQARVLSIEPGARFVAYSRRAFDMWNSRYFVLPYAPKWDDEHRGIASFLDATERVEPPADAFLGPGGQEKEHQWWTTHDYQVLRNRNAYPRAWVVHDARSVHPFASFARAERNVAMQEILFSNDRFWHDPTRTVYDPRQTAWVEDVDRAAIARFFDGGLASSAESARVAGYEPDRVVLDVALERPGMVVLADVHYPGWSLTIDGRPSPVYRVNRLMRGAAVESGRHTLVYTYRPLSFRVGLAVSRVGLLALALLGVWFLVGPAATVPPTSFSRELRP